MADQNIYGLAFLPSPAASDNIYVVRGNTDNYASLASLPISTATQAALDNKASTASVEAKENVLAFASPLARAGDNVSITLANASTSGYLSNTDWSTFNAKEPAITAGTTAQYWRGDKSFQNLTATAVGLGAVSNNAQAFASIYPNNTPGDAQLLVANANAFANVTLSGDATLSAVGALTIGDRAVTYAKIQNVTAQGIPARSATTDGPLATVTLGASELLGRGASGNIANITLGSGLSMTGTTLSATASGSGGYVISFGASATLAPADAATYYFGPFVGLVTSSTTNPIYIPKTGAIKKVSFIWQGQTTAGSSEDISLYVRVNDTTDTLVQTIGDTNAFKHFLNTELNIAVTAGDTINLKMVTPTWATNPSGVRLGFMVYIE